MLNGLIAFAVQRWQATLVLFALIAAMGLQALISIPRSVDPHFTAPVVQVIAVLPGADPTDMEQTVAKPVEEAMAGLDNITKITSTSRDGQAVVVIEFSWESDPEYNYDQAVRELNALRPNLPAGLQRLEYRRTRTSDSAIVQYAVVSPTASWRRMEKVGKDLKELFQRQPGVRSATVWGVPKPEIRVLADAGRMAEMGLPLTVLADSLRVGGVDMPPGPLHVGDQRYNLKAGGAFQSLAEVEALPLRVSGDQVVRVRDVATVSWETNERQHITRLNGQRAIWVTATQKPGENVFDVRNAVRAAADGYQPNLPPDMQLVNTFDQSDDVDRKLSLLGRDFALALVLVLVTLLPLGTRASFVVMISVPLSLAMGTLAMWWLGHTLNQLVITGFILALGLLVDDSIVVVENIARHLRMGYSRTAAALAGTQQIAVAVVGCTAVLIFAFLPLSALPGGPGKFTKGLPLSVMLTVLASLFVSLTIVPFLASRILPKAEKAEGNRILQAVESGIGRFYGPVLHWALERPKLAFWGAMALCVATLGLVPVLGTSLFPSSDTPYMMIDIEASEGSDLGVTDRAVRFVEAELAKRPEVKDVMANVGRGNPQLYYNMRELTQKSSYGSVAFTLNGYDPEETPAFIEAMRARFASYPEARIILEPFKNGSPVDAPIQWYLSGPDLGVLRDLSRKVEAEMRATPGTRDVRNPLAFERVDVNLGLDTDKAALLGVAPAAARRTARIALAGEANGRFRDAEGDSYDVMLRVQSDALRQPEGPAKDVEPGALVSVDVLGQLYVPSSSGAAVPMHVLASPKLASGPALVFRFKQQRSVSLTSNVATGYLTSKVNEDIGQRLAQLELPRGYTLALGGEAQAQSDSLNGMTGAVLLALFGIFAVLVLEFGRFRETVVVLGVIPLGTFGGLIALWLTGYSISFTAVIGFVALIGIEIKNSILLVDFTTQLRQQGMELRAAIERAGEVRFLPVLLTSVTAVLALLPLAVSGSPLYGPLACVIIGGLISSTLLSRIVTPVMYLLLVRGAPDSPTLEDIPPPLAETIGHP